ncbi:acyltransferase family protein [Pontibacter pudoricolor]|uniref:acyltransferase family protein n=1 Tax=Pontibacter pudoricolor TaxID=2694930 RepID=UPI0013913977|nr:acyltransferase [Pontibacter pudoricolor]
MKLVYYKELDGVRGIAALMVMILHFFGQRLYQSSVWPPILKFSVLGQTGVDLFFVLSGFLITRILLDTKQQEGYFKKFYMRRSIRIFPLYFGFLILTYFILPLFTNENIPTLSSQIYHWLYLQNFAMTFQWIYTGPEHFWSLAVEEHFYLVWPLLVFLLNRRQLLIVILTIIGIALIVRIFLVSSGYEAYYLTFARMDVLSLGGLLAIAEHKNLLSRIKPIVVIALALTLSLPTIYLFLKFGGEGNSYIQIIKPLLIGLFFLLAVTYVVVEKESSTIKILLNSTIFNYTGKISYGLYVYHPLCFSIYSRFLRSESIIADLIGSFLLSYLISTLSFYFFENKVLKFKKYFEYSHVEKQKTLVPSRH